jgi:hypothetical protein
MASACFAVAEARAAAFEGGGVVRVVRVIRLAGDVADGGERVGLGVVRLDRVGVRPAVVDQRCGDGSGTAEERRSDDAGGDQSECAGAGAHGGSSGGTRGRGDAR